MNLEKLDLKDLQRLMEGKALIDRTPSELNAWIITLVRTARSKHLNGIKVYHPRVDRWTKRDPNELALSLDVPWGRKGMEYLHFTLHIVRGRRATPLQLCQLTQRVIQAFDGTDDYVDGRPVYCRCAKERLDLRMASHDNPMVPKWYANSVLFVASFEEELEFADLEEDDLDVVQDERGEEELCSYIMPESQDADGDPPLDEEENDQARPSRRRWDDE